MDPVAATLDDASARVPPIDAGAPAERASPLAVGVVVWLASEAMFFGGLFAAWFVLKAHNEPSWPPRGDDLDALRTFAFTLALVASSFTVHHAVTLAEGGRRRAAARWLGITFVLGATFIAGEAFEYYRLPFAFDRDSFSSIFYLLTGFHGAHVIGGLVLMVVVAWIVFSRESRAPLGSSFRVTSYYWHFVDVVWVVLFLVVYVIR